MQGCVEYVSQKAGNISWCHRDGAGNHCSQRGQECVSRDRERQFGNVLRSSGAGSGGNGVARFPHQQYPCGREPVVLRNAQRGCAGSGLDPGLWSGAFNLSNSSPFVGFVTKGLTTGVTSAPTLNQGSAQTLSPASTLSFTENFGTSFKTRVLAQNNSNYAGQSGTPVQNIPGAIYNSESNFVLPVASGHTPSLTDFGTRLKAVFRNVSAGSSVCLSSRCSKQRFARCRAGGDWRVGRE